MCVVIGLQATHNAPAVATDVENFVPSSDGALNFAVVAPKSAGEQAHGLVVVFLVLRVRVPVVHIFPKRGRQPEAHGAKRTIHERGGT